VDLEEDQEKMMPYYEFECDKCGYIIERFYRVIPRIDPTQIRDDCPNCLELDTTFKKVISKNSFHLSNEGCGWAKDGYDRGSQDGSKVVSIDEP
jgi:putative FmdB family regulatory protein